MMRDVCWRLKEDWNRSGIGFQQFTMGMLAGIFFTAIIAIGVLA